MTAKKSQIPLVRFPEFTTPWEAKAIARMLERRADPVVVKPDTSYRQIGLRSHGKGIFHKAGVTGEALGNKRVFWVQPDCFVVNIIFAWEQAVGKTSAQEAGMIASHRFPMYGAKKCKADIDFIVRFFLRPRGKHLLGLASPGGAGRNRTLGQKDFEKLQLTIPTLPEQRKIADFLTAVDQRIRQLSQKKALLVSYKKGVMQQLFSQVLRFKDDHGNDFPDWEEKTLGEVGTVVGGGTPDSAKDDYWNGDIEWFTPTEIRSKYAGGSRRKITASGMKNCSASILPVGTLLMTSRATIAEISISTIPCTTNQGFQSIITNSENNNEFIYYWINNNKKMFLRRSQGSTFIEISGKEVRKLAISIPSLPEQTKIANFLTALDRKIESVAQQITHTQTFKKGLLQQMFV